MSSFTPLLRQRKNKCSIIYRRLQCGRPHNILMSCLSQQAYETCWLVIYWNSGNFEPVGQRTSNYNTKYHDINHQRTKMHLCLEAIYLSLSHFMPPDMPPSMNSLSFKWLRQQETTLLFICLSRIIFTMLEVRYVIFYIWCLYWSSTAEKPVATKWNYRRSDDNFWRRIVMHRRFERKC